MKLLVDTHAFVWSFIEPERLPRRVAEALLDEANGIYVSAASAYEIELKRTRDEALARMPDDLDEAMFEQGFVWIGITPDEAIAAGRLPRLHRDPWDRVLVAQARLRDMTLVTRDAQIARYDAPILW